MTNAKVGHCGFFSIPIEDRFWNKVDVSSKDKCWSWKSTMRGLYGSIKSVGGKKVSAHRLAYKLSYGEIPDSQCVLHKCDNPKCVNPSHLFLGTRGDNNRDRARKGRSNPTRGELSVKAKLKDSEVSEIRRLYSTGKIRQKDLAMMFHVDQSNVSVIVNNKRRIRV